MATDGDELEVLVISSQKGQAKGMMFPKVINNVLRTNDAQY